MPHIVAATDAMISQAAALLRDGKTVAFPTETVYGLGADTFNARGLATVYQLKGRPFDNPLIAHVRDWEVAAALMQPPRDQDGATSRVSAKIGEHLARRFWPGPLTLVVEKSQNVPAKATAGLHTIAIRSPAHAVARRLLDAFGGPISAPSANRSGYVSPTAAEHVAHDFADVEDLLILDGGRCDVGIESTVLDLTSDPPRVLRAGSVSIEQLRSVIGEVTPTRVSRQDIAPGTAARHYAPRTPAELVNTDQLRERLRHADSPLAVLTFQPALVAPPHHAVGMPPTAQEYARSLYSALRQADALNCQRILIEIPPGEDDLWRAIHDRLHRAAIHG